MKQPDPTLRTVADLRASALVSNANAADLASVTERYAMAISPAMATLIDPADPDDPIARQFVPDARELETRPEELSDPIGDNLKSPLPGLVHRYKDRVLLKVVGVCPVYCRFCFRREMVGPELGRSPAPDELAAALAYIRAHEEISEVIVTGGDPLMLSARRIAGLTHELSSIAHVKVLRWHTRVPVVTPERVTADVAAALTQTDRAVWVAIHANHPRELTADALSACQRLARAGASLISQSVLLKGVNDDADTLEALFRTFHQAGIKPYYLHHADLAPGTSHFRTTVAEGQTLMRELRRRLSGVALPTYTLDIPGAHGKVPIGASHIAAAEDGGGWIVTDADGNTHRYGDQA